MRTKDTKGKRLESKKNKKAIKELLSKITESGLTITRESFGDGYFIFDLGKNNVCWFWLKELPEWKFGIWKHNTEDGSVKFDLFGQVEVCIDKFKPSRSGELYETDIDSFVEELHRLNNNKWKELYPGLNESYEYELLSIKISKEQSDILYKKVKNIVESYSETIGSREYFLVIEDKNTKNLRYWPRYDISLFYNGPNEDADSPELKEIDSIKNKLQALLEDEPKYFNMKNETIITRHDVKHLKFDSDFYDEHVGLNIESFSLLF